LNVRKLESWNVGKGWFPSLNIQTFLYLGLNVRRLEGLKVGEERPFPTF